MRSELREDPDVIEIARLTNDHEFAVVGRLHAIWSWLDKHSEDGTNVRIASAYLDRLAACPGFAEAMRAVDWLSGRDGALTFPGYGNHNGETAKARAVTQKRVAEHRRKAQPPVTPPSTPVTPPALPEESREEKSIAAHAPREEDDLPLEDLPDSPPGTSPPLKHWVAACKRYMIPEWYAQRKHEDFCAKGWRSGHTPIIWKAAVVWVKRDYENDGRPTEPSKPQRNGNHDRNDRFAADREIHNKKSKFGV